MTHNAITGEKIKLSGHFNNEQLGNSHVRNFVLNSQIDGWQMTFQKNTFTTASMTCDNDTTYKIAFMYCFTKDNDNTKMLWGKKLSKEVTLLSCPETSND